ncbi:MAG: membrane dipeptidase [Lysobacterales bacterium]|jgi:membrane dipeptidase
MIKKYLITAISLSVLFASYAQAEEDFSVSAAQITHKYPLIDTHIDVPYRIHNAWDDVTVGTDSGDFDYPRAMAGGLNIPFMSIYTPADSEVSGKSNQLAHELIDGVEAMVGRAPDKFMMAHSVSDVESAMAQGKIGLALGMENGSPIAGELSNVEVFAKRGIRYITLAHSSSNHISDSSFDTNRQWNGLSEFGREVVAEMNRVGVMVDISHVSDEAFWQVLDISKVPVIASHSSLRHFVPGFERNMSDDMLKALAKNGGVIQINFGSAFIDPESNKILLKLFAERAEFMAKNSVTAGSPETREFIAAFRESNPTRFASTSQVVDHFDHVVSLVGADHVGIGSDYDGVGDSLPTGLKDVSAYPNLVAEFLKRGYTEEDIAKILGGNLLRVWGEVETYAKGH